MPCRADGSLVVRRTDHSGCLALQTVMVCVSKLDQTINPDLERFLAKRMNAHRGAECRHLSLVSHPREIANLILAAAGRKQ